MAAANRRDFVVLFGGFDPSIEYHPIELFPDPDPVYYGHDGYRRMWGFVLDAFEDARLDPEELVDFGDRLLITTRLSGHGAGSGIAFNERLFQVYMLKDGLVIWQRDYQDRAAALDALGIAE